MRRSMLAAGAVMVVAGLGIGASGAEAAGQALVEAAAKGRPIRSASGR